MMASRAECVIGVWGVGLWRLVTFVSSTPPRRSHLSVLPVIVRTRTVDRIISGSSAIRLTIVSCRAGTKLMSTFVAIEALSHSVLGLPHQAASSRGHSPARLTALSRRSLAPSVRGVAGASRLIPQLCCYVTTATVARGTVSRPDPEQDATRHLPHQGRRWGPCASSAVSSRSRREEPPEARAARRVSSPEHHLDAGQLARGVPLVDDQVAAAELAPPADARLLDRVRVALGRPRLRPEDVLVFLLLALILAGVLVLRGRHRLRLLALAHQLRLRMITSKKMQVAAVPQKALAGGAPPLARRPAVPDERRADRPPGAHHRRVPARGVERARRVRQRLLEIRAAELRDRAVGAPAPRVVVRGPLRAELDLDGLRLLGRRAQARALEPAVEVDRRLHDRGRRAGRMPRREELRLHRRIPAAVDRP